MIVQKLSSHLSIILLVAFQYSQSQTIQKADSLYQTGDYTNAIEAYNHLHALTPKVLAQIARSYKGKGIYDQALQFYQKALTIDQNEIVLKTEYARLLMATSNFKEADSTYQILIGQSPENPEFQYRLGMVKSKLNDSTAINYFKKAFALDHTHQKSCYEISRYYLKKADFDSVYQTANLGLKSYADNAELISIIGQAHLFQANFLKALPFFEKLIKLNQKNEFTHSKLGLCYLKTYSYKEAIEQFNLALKYDPKDASKHLLVAEAYQMINEYDEAIKHIKTAIELKDPAIDREYASLAINYSLKQNYKTTMDYIKKAIKENPNSNRYQYMLATFADKYYDDPNLKLKYYTNLINNKEGRESKFYMTLAEKRIKQLQKEIDTTKK